MSAKVFVFGVDAMDPRLIQDWIGSGHLPNLERLRDRSARSTVLSSPRFFSAAKWTSFHTGVSPARHGQYMQTLYDPNTCVHRPFRPASSVRPFWSRPGWQAKRTAILNVPFCAIDESINGLQVVDWSVHDRFGERVRTAPFELGRDVLSAYENEPFTSCSATEPTTAGFAQLRDQLIRWIRRKRDLTCRLVAGDRWDLFVSVFDETHCAGHLFWCMHDATHPRHDPDSHATLRHALRDVYSEVDSALGAVLGLLDPESTIVFLTCDGIEPAHDAVTVLDEILRRLDGLPPRVADYEELRARQLARLGDVSERMPRLAQRALAAPRRWFGRGRLGDRLRDERRRRRCFWFPTQHFLGGIRINLAGREASGIVRPGPECEEFIEQLTADLYQLRDGRSGQPIVSEVVRATDAKEGCFAGEPPDLIVQWSKAALSWVESPKIGRLQPPSISSADHDPRVRGLFFAAGPRSTAGELADPVHIEDFAPTISHLLDVDLVDTEGSSIPAVCGTHFDRASAR